MTAPEPRSTRDLKRQISALARKFAAMRDSSGSIRLLSATMVVDEMMNAFPWLRGERR